ncbi:MAG: tRNA uridine-5-carboxymethylaminomethyl(34) synthesis GTPase MnmE [Actinobacteria bacterium]|nr:tRNA uridine-5-carboxymethylaminomethyl(34) synthesis GTPase MnmE [Actinomycetota bacterium]
MEEDTITALATKAGESAVNIIKISGNNSIEIAQKIFKSKSQRKLQELKTYSMIYGNIYDENGDIIDEVIISIMKTPHSYTREDVVEINCHGGIAAVNKILDLVIKSGARLAEPGEFTKRAFMNGRIDLTQVEAIADIIYAKTETSLKIAANNLKGILSQEIKSIRKDLLDLIIDVEASIDFTEEDIEIITYDEMLKRVKFISSKLKELIKNEEKGEIVKNGIKVAIIGKPNVGKSSLLNLIIKKDKAIVTPIPGTTRDAVEEILYLNGIPVIMTDTAGIRESKNMIEKIGVNKSMGEIERSDILIIVIDNSRKITNEDIEILNKSKEKKHILCINKIDKKSKIDKMEIKKYIDEKLIVEVSALKNTGIDKLEEKIKDLTIGKDRFEIEEKIIINKRQKITIQKAKESIDNAINAIKNKLSQEFPALDLRNAYNLLGEIIGENTNEDILNGIFSKFCVGK